MVIETTQASLEAVEEHQPLYVWELPVRIAHWTHVGSMLALAISGYYIGAPFLATAGYGVGPYAMGIMRLIHAVSATFLVLSLIARLYWAIVGNRYARFSALLPVTAEKRQNLWQQLKYYLFLTTQRPDYVGHNPVAGLTYIVLYVLVLAQAVTGLALYSEYFPRGFWWITFGWAFRWIARNNILRLLHHSLMWAFLVFFLVHLYLVILNDLVERSGLASSIVTGYKCHRTDVTDPK
jgi:Ni/Fe-hydrogenase 1 B-type cytochrome subunit